MRNEISMKHRGLVVQAIFKDKQPLSYHYLIKEPGEDFVHVDVRDFLELPDKFYMSHVSERIAMVVMAYIEYKIGE